MEKLDNGAGGKLPEVFGEEVKQTFKQGIDSLYNARAAQATQDYSIFNGNKTKVPQAEFWNKVQELSELYSPLRTTLKKGIQLGKNIIKEGDDFTTISTLVDNRKFLSQIARGNGKLFEGLDSQAERTIARDLMNSIDQDLIKAADYTENPQLRERLLEANKNYFNNSQIIRELKSSVLGRALRGLDADAKSGVDITNKVLSAKPDELRAILSMTEFEDPAFRSGLKEQYARRFLEAGIRGGKDIMPGTVPYNPKAAFDSAMGDKNGTFRIIFETPQERTAALDAMRFNQRLAQDIPKTALPRSGPEEKMIEASRLPGGSMLTFGPSFLMKWYTGPVAAKLIFDPQGQKALRTIVSSHPTTKAYSAASAYLIEQTMKSPSEGEAAEFVPPKGVQ
jgi:hypothetical protein